jgi:hypothetical protein
VLQRLIPCDYDPESTHKALQAAADKFYAEKGLLMAAGPTLNGPEGGS